MPNDGHNAGGTSAPLLTLVEDTAETDIPPLVVLATDLSLAPTSPANPAQSACALTVGGQDERGNTVKYIYACDPDYVVYYSRLEHGRAAAGDRAPSRGTSSHRLRRLLRFGGRPIHDTAYESEGVQAQLSGHAKQAPDAASRPAVAGHRTRQTASPAQRLAASAKL